MRVLTASLASMRLLLQKQCAGSALGLLSLSVLSHTKMKNNTPAMHAPSTTSATPVHRAAAQAEAAQTILAALIDGHAVSDGRKESLRLAIEAGADDATLALIRDAKRVKRDSSTIILPLGRYDHCSRGKGWCRRGKGGSAEWADKHEDTGLWIVDAGRWTVGTSDGFSRKDQTEWVVKTIVVGAQKWTIAN